MDSKDLLTGWRYRQGMKPTITAALLLFAYPAAAQDISGPARAGDGDSLDFSGISVRLFGVDAPELAQSCERGGASWACGKQAASKLASLVANKSVVCEQKDIDDYGRIVAACRAGSIDLGGAMVDAGLAVALPHFSDRYVTAEARARVAGLGLWNGTFQMPADYRAAYPKPGQRTPSLSRGAARARAPDRAPSPAPSRVYFRNCKEAWAAGAAPLRRGQPGYRPEMDGDDDGIACEPYHRR
jgi:endonuclease YncB( thermonuclease family)